MSEAKKMCFVRSVADSIRVTLGIIGSIWAFGGGKWIIGILFCATTLLNLFNLVFCILGLFIPEAANTLAEIDEDFVRNVGIDVEKGWIEREKEEDEDVEDCDH